MINSIGKAFAVCVRRLPDVIRDLVGIGAVVLIAYGSWLIYQPVGFIVAGVLVLIGVLMNSLGRARGAGG